MLCVGSTPLPPLSPSFPSLLWIVLQFSSVGQFWLLTASSPPPALFNEDFVYIWLWRVCSFQVVLCVIYTDVDVIFVYPWGWGEPRVLHCHCPRKSFIIFLKRSVRGNASVSLCVHFIDISFDPSIWRKTSFLMSSIVIWQLSPKIFSITFVFKVICKCTWKIFLLILMKF